MAPRNHFFKAMWQRYGKTTPTIKDRREPRGGNRNETVDLLSEYEEEVEETSQKAEMLFQREAEINVKCEVWRAGDGSHLICLQIPKAKCFDIYYPEDASALAAILYDTGAWSLASALTDCANFLLEFEIKGNG